MHPSWISLPPRLLRSLGISAAAAVMSLTAVPPASGQATDGQPTAVVAGKGKAKGKDAGKGGASKGGAPKILKPRVKAEVKNPNGKVATSAQTFIEWDDGGSVAFDGGGASHRIEIKVKELGNKQLDVTMSYYRDGQLYVQDYNYQEKDRKRFFMQVEGGIAIAITVAIAEWDTGAPKGREDGVDGPAGDPDDPLGGI